MSRTFENRISMLQVPLPNIVDSMFYFRGYQTSTKNMVSCYLLHAGVVFEST
jgi:hypothetical protein